MYRVTKSLQTGTGLDSRLNKGFSKARDVRAKLVPFRNSASVVGEETEFGDIGESEFKRAKDSFVVEVLVDSVQVEKFTLVISDRENNLWEMEMESPIQGNTL